MVFRFQWCSKVFCSFEIEFNGFNGGFNGWEYVQKRGGVEGVWWLLKQGSATKCNCVITAIEFPNISKLTEYTFTYTKVLLFFYTWFMSTINRMPRGYSR